MARTNKYASLNFNEIYDKQKINNNNSTSLTPKKTTILSNSRIHGNMLVKTRPTPKPILHPQPQTTTPDRTGLGSDSISLRPLGNTGSGPIIIPVTVYKESDLSVSPKSNKFVPPHLRPGFSGKEDKPIQLRPVGSPNGRPKYSSRRLEVQIK